MIRSENAPTLCPRCCHFTKGIDVGCRVTKGIGPTTDAVREWLQKQTHESSWAWGRPWVCPGFLDNESSPDLMSPEDRRALVQIRLSR